MKRADKLKKLIKIIEQLSQMAPRLRLHASDKEQMEHHLKEWNKFMGGGGE